MGRQRAEVEELRQQLEASSSAVTRALKEEYTKEKEEQERRHQVKFSPCLWALDLQFWVLALLGFCPQPALGAAAVGAEQLSCLSQAEMKVLKERMEMEKQAWEANYMKKEVIARAALP